MSLITLTDITAQDKERGKSFSFTKLIEFDATIDTITAFSLVSNTAPDTITLTLEADGSPVTFPVDTSGVTEFKIRLAGKYDLLFDDDVVKHVPAGQSTRTKYADFESSPEIPERELTDSEFAEEQVKFPSLVKPTIGNNILNLPDNVELIKAQRGVDEKEITYTVSITYEVSSSSTTESKSFKHTALNNDDIFNQLIGRATAQRVQVADNINALAFGKTKLLGNINTATLNTIQDTEPFVTEPNAANFGDLWNSALAGNVCKWQPVESTQGQFDFSGADILHAHCKRHGNKMLWHTLIWGADQGTPDWWEGLSVSASKAAFEAWCSAISTRYGDDIYGIQTLNEIATGHQDAGTTRIINQFGGAGTSGYDWAIYIFETARYYFPNALLWINDFGMISNQTVRNENCAVANAIKNHNPNLIDAVGMQCHFFNINDLSASEITTAIDDVYNQTGLPIHVTELDISGTNDDSPETSIDQKQLERYQIIFPAIWTHPRVERVNIWGYIYGENWRFDQGHATGLINRDGTGERPAFTFLKNYMETAT